MTASTRTKPTKAEPSKVRTNLIVQTFRSKPLQMVKHPYKNRVTPRSKKTVDLSSSNSARRNELFQHFSVSTNPTDKLSYAFDKIKVGRSVDTSVEDDERTKIVNILWKLILFIR